MIRYRATFRTTGGPVTVTVTATDRADALAIVQRYASIAFRGRLTSTGREMAIIRLRPDSDERAA